MKPGGLRRYVVGLAVFVGLGLAFTVASLYASAPSTKVGTLRSLGTIPIHELELVAMGVAIGLLATVASRKLSAVTFVLPVAMIVLLDLDHFPAALGLPQPIRPAHSVFFIFLVVAVLWVLKQPPETELLSVSAFIGHLGVDNGVFPLFSPFSFTYYRLIAYRPELLAASGGIALLAGFAYRRGSGAVLRPGMRAAAEGHP